MGDVEMLRSNHVTNRHNFQQVTVPYDRSGPDRRKEYRSLLLEHVFPVIDELLELGKIDSYHFLTHSGLDLRLSICDEQDLATVEQVLRKHGLPAELTPWDPKHERIEEEDEVLRLNAEITRVLLKHPDPDSFYYLVVHYQNNMFGMGNDEEVTFHLKQALNWLTTIKVNREGKDEVTARREAARQVRDWLANLSGA
jgi:hypothetical protein